MFIMPIPNNFSKLESSELQALNSNFFWVLFFAAFGKRPGNASATAVAFGLDDITTWVDNTFWDRKGSLCEFLEPEHIRWKFRIRIFWCSPWAGRFQDIQTGIGGLWNWTMATTSLANCVKVQFWNRIVQYLCSESILVQKVSSGRISKYPVSFKETFLFQYTCHFLSQFGPRVDQPSDTFSYDDFVSFMIYLLNQNR